jgi:hypothetical protein
VADVLPAGQAYPAVQDPVQAGVVSPDDAPNLPVGHAAVHDAFESPAVEPYSPWLQLVHADAAAREYWPAGHTAAVADVEPAGQTYPAVQGPLQAAEPNAAVAPYRPAAHWVQEPAPAREYWPAAHGVAVADVDPAGQAYPAVHGPEQVAAVSPAASP